MFNDANGSLLLLMDVSLKALLLAAVAALGLPVFRVQNSHVRHLVWTAVLVGMLLMPLLVHVVPSLTIPIPAFASVKQPVHAIDSTEGVAKLPVVAAPSSESAVSTSVPMNDATRRQVPTGRRVKVALANELPGTTSVTRYETESRVATTIRLQDAIAVFSTVLLLTYLCVAVSLALRLAVGLIRATMLIYGSVPIAEQCRLLPSGTAGMLCETSSIRVPLTVGFLKPRVLVPPSWRTWSQEKREAVIRHELAHIARGDWLVNLLAESNRCLYWFHPLAWCLIRWLSDLAERNCDDAVIASTGDRTSYARHLLEIAASVIGPKSADMRTSVSMARSADVAARIQAILDTQRPLSKPVGWRNTLSLLAVMLPICWVAAALQAKTSERAATFAATTQETTKSPTVGGTGLLSGENRREVATNPRRVVDTFRQPVPGGPFSVVMQRGIAVRETQNAPVAREDSDFVIAGQCIRREDRSTTIAGVKIRLLAAIGLREQIREMATTVSDAQGQFRFEGLRRPRENRLDGLQYFLVANIEEQPVRIDKIWNPADALRTRVYISQNSVSLKGRVQDERGERVRGARLEPFHGGRLGLDANPSTETNEQGLFILAGLPALVDRQGNPMATSIVVTHPDFPATILTAKSVPGVSTFTLTAGCRVTGVVQDALSGKPLAGVVVSAIIAEAHSGREANAVTDTDGRYRLNLLEGNYNVILEDLNFVAAAATDLECRNGGRLELKPILASAGGWLTGQVVNTDTGQPMVFNPERQRIALGLYGPNRPQGRLVHQHLLAEVDDEGRFRMRASPGENFPFFCNLRGARMAWDTLKQAPVVIVAGQETSCVMEFTPPRTSEQKMEIAQRVLSALPVATDKRVVAIIEEFRKLNHTVDECEIWCLLMRDLVTIGKPAVLPLCKELEATDEQRMMRRLAFALRAIGDPRAVPTLIRNLPKTLQPPMSDYGLIVEDNELAAFMRQHSIGGGARDQGKYFSFGRPVRETHDALTYLTKRTIDGSELFGMHRSVDVRALVRQEKRFHEAALEWGAWWEANWERFGVDASFSTVNVPAHTPPDLRDYPTGRELTANAKVDGGSSGNLLSPIGEPDAGADFFLDLDTGGELLWPAELARHDSSAETVNAAREWGAKKGADLMCVAMPDDEGNVAYTLAGIGLQLWEIDSFDAKNIAKRVSDGKLPEGRQSHGFLNHYDAKARKHVHQRGISFLYVTREHGLGVITITDLVTETRDLTGQPFTPQGVGFHRGVRFDYKTIAR